MNGIGTTKMGGIPSTINPVSVHNKHFKYYKLRFPTWSRAHAIKMVEDSMYTPLVYFGLRWLYLGDRPGGGNMLFREGTTLTSNVLGAEVMSSFLTDMKEFPTVVPKDLEVIAPTHSDVSLFISFPTRVYISLVSFNISYMHSGCILYGSNDEVGWDVIQDVSWSEAKKRYNNYAYWGAGWFSFMLWSNTEVKKPTNPKYWGILVGATKTTYSPEITLIEFRDGVGGNDLCVGGAYSPFVSLSTYIIDPPLFDGRTDTYWRISAGYGMGYRFPGVVHPATVAIILNAGYDKHPLNFVVLCSEDEQVWFVHTTIDTPEGTWQDNVLSTAEFIL